MGIPGDTCSSWDWHEEHPPLQDFTHWKWVTALLVDERKNLHIPLGCWLAQSHHQWVWYYAMLGGILFYEECRSMGIIPSW